MREATEAPNNRQMLAGRALKILDQYGPFRGSSRQHGISTTYRFRLEGQVLGVLERHQTKQLLQHTQRGIQGALKAAPGDVLRQRVGRKGRGRAAIEITRQLVQGENQRQPPAGAGFPGRQSAGPGLPDEIGKAGADDGIGFGRGLKPKRITLFGLVRVRSRIGEPELEQLFGVHRRPGYPLYWRILTASPS